MFVRTKRSGNHEYLQIVRSFREGPKVRQQVVATLGRRDVLAASGELDKLLESLAGFSSRLRVVEAVRTGGLEARYTREWGPALVFGRLWERQGLPEILPGLVAKRRLEFSFERMVFAMALQRLSSPGSDLQGSGWIGRVEAEELEGLALQHFYRATGVLSQVREELERALYLRDRDLFGQTLDLVLLDTTSLYVYRDTETEWRKRGYSRDRRGDLPQLVLCVAVDQDGWPMAWDIWPGNTADPSAFRPMIRKLRERFHIGRVVIVADRGMISEEAMQDLTGHAEAPLDYIFGCRMRNQKVVREQVLPRASGWEEVTPNLRVAEVGVAGRRYIVCENPAEARKDAEARGLVLAKLKETLEKHGPKAVIGNRGFARFVKVAKGSVSINREAVEADAQFDGKFVLTTSTPRPAVETAQAYKGLWRVERTFREEKSTLQVRPIFHHRDDTSIGHIVASFLALRLEVDLQRRLDERGVTTSWPDLMRDLKGVQAVIVDLDGQRYRLRTDLPGCAYEAFAAAGVRPPPPLTPLGPSPPKAPAQVEENM